MPLKIHSIYRPSRDGGWLRMTGEELVRGMSEEDGEEERIL